MPVHERKERERANRHRLIVSTARELAEAHGWDAVTTRRLAERIEYSQPVLYSHFRGKNEIVAAVALEGFTELAAALRAAAPQGAADRQAVIALARAYTDFAAANPALYDAMFSLDNGLAFADEATPAPLREGFQALLDPLADHAHPNDPGLFAETFWAALHGLATLTRAGRLPVARTPTGSPSWPTASSPGPDPAPLDGPA
ncbi:TetR/AcrR family transcriptional regulator [Streptacidiphilus sp. PB12-B1b]|uniref:TetR/AcrR family transcriptional regulator n=1 Tax=Streptacidiphilus sp. PB12-B1b TaxID=2705012 RepID=UPI0015FBF39D|nr:TetR/AcrR family transcriptional regulator [Streptacidiphilus sp. PB12-B1b]QMU79581.1 TetR/AcrR family transcriptional regulator [Streptacidiphilus sp. PB12-B1b]